MLRYQDSLPRLPVPDLSQSLQRYVEAITPIVGADQLERTKRIVKEFGRAGGQGEQLQSRLKERAETKENWVSKSRAMQLGTSSVNVNGESPKSYQLW